MGPWSCRQGNNIKPKITAIRGVSQIGGLRRRSKMIYRLKQIGDALLVITFFLFIHLVILILLLIDAYEEVAERIRVKKSGVK